MNIIDQIFGNCEKGVHRFKQFTLHKGSAQFPQGAHIKGYNIEEVLESFTEYTYEVRCKFCGKKAE